MKTIEELILAQTSSTEPPPVKHENKEPHYINLKMNYNGGKRGRKTEEERKELENEFKLKVSREKVYIFFD